MAFSFGNTSTSAFGTAQQKTTGFATPFGAAQPTTTQSTSFGFGQTQAAPAFGSTFGAAPTGAPPAFGSTFGATNTVTPAFGMNTTAPAFGANPATPAFGANTTTPAFGANTTAPAFGSTFGAPASTAAPAFGSTFGATAPQGTGLFGQTAAKPTGGLFGAPATATPSLFGTAATSAPSLFGGGVQTTQSAGLFGTTTTPSLFGQPTTQATTVPSLFGSSFGQPTTTTAAPAFGGSMFGSTQPGFGFGATTTSAGGFGGFGTGTTSTFGGFGTATNTAGSLFGPKPAQPAVTQPATLQSKAQQVIASVYSINVFNDERDEILKKWNMLQACWGTGKGYYNPSQPPVEYNSENPFYRFKAMGYNIIPEQDNSEGVVKLVFNKKHADLKNQQEVLKNGIAGILGNRPNLTVEIVLIRAMSDSQTEVRIVVSEKGVTGTSRKIPATDLAAFLNQPTQKQQLTNVGVTSLLPFVTPSKTELEEYLKTPPPGVETQLWQAAIQDNPNPKKYIPVPINGFADLKARMRNQEYQSGLHAAYLDKVDGDILRLKSRRTAAEAQISELKSKFLELQHRILKILVKQESSRKVGIGIQPEEEILRGRMEVIHAQLNTPKQLKGQINELLSHIKMIGHAAIPQVQYRLDADAQEEIKNYLRMEQNGIAELINVANADLQALKTITEGLKEMNQKEGTTMSLSLGM